MIELNIGGFMKIQVRNSVFIHSLTMCLRSEYDSWKNGEVMLYTGGGWDYPKYYSPKKSHFYTKEEAIAFVKSSDYPPSKDFNWNDDNAIMKMLRSKQWCDSDYYWNNYCSEYETFKDTIVTPSGDEVITFGHYGIMD